MTKEEWQELTPEQQWQAYLALEEYADQLELNEEKSQ